jgi:hypothetical protein
VLSIPPDQTVPLSLKWRYGTVDNCQGAATHPGTFIGPVHKGDAHPLGTGGDPTLGQLAGLFSHGSGFGSVAPARFSNGGDPTGSVGSITWQSLGDATAIGTSVSDWERHACANGPLNRVWRVPR